jgi:pyridinium-3,5-biscarboxylic acid mononucleotide synthase
MNIDSLKQILEQVAAGKSPVDQALEKLRHISFQDINFAHIDHHRFVRKAFPEVVCKS